MSNTVNPYVSGPPVYGDKFYGRQQDLQKVLATDHKLILFIATRRMGKTSLCRQIKHRCESENSYSSNFCVNWDLQGIRDISRAKRRLLTPPNQKSLKKVDWNQIKTIPTCNKVIEAFCDPYSKLPSNETVLMLLDEPDTFLHFVESREYDFLVDLKYTFETVPNLRVVIVSPPRILNLFMNKEIPCLLEDFQINFLREFDAEEAKNLVLLSELKSSISLKFLENGQQVIKDIIEVSNKVPFYIQRICSDIFDAYPSQRPSKVMENIIERQTFSPFFTSDFSELHPIQKIMLLNLVNCNEPQEGQFLIDVTINVAPKIKGQSPTLKYIDDLVNLGILKKYEGNKYHFSNKLFDRWILRDFDNLWNQTMEEIVIEKTFDKKIFNPKSLKKKDLEEIRAELEAFQRVLKKLEKDYSNGTVDKEFYYKKLPSMVIEKELLIKKVQDHLSSHSAHELAQVLEQVKQDDINEIEIMDSLTRAEQEGQNKVWGDIVSLAIKDNSISRVEASIKAAFEVAEYLVNND